MSRLAATTVEAVARLLRVDPSELESRYGRFVSCESRRAEAERRLRRDQDEEETRARERRERLQAIVRAGRLLQQEDASGRALDELTVLVGRPLQYELISRVIHSPDELNYPDEYDRALERTPWVPRIGNRSWNAAVNMPPERLALSRNLILPRVWNRSRLLEWLPLLGPDRRSWVEDEGNHYVQWLWPLRVGFVIGGNHSIACGVSAGVGVLTPKESYDLSGIYRCIRCDGDSYREIGTGDHVARVEDERLAAIFELGRLRLGRALPSGHVPSGGNVP